MKVLTAALAGACMIAPALGQDRGIGRGIETIQTPMIGQNGVPLGTVTVRGSANATIIRIVLRPGSLKPGWHGVHIHSVANCTGAGFLLAKGHVNHLAKTHGMLHPEGPDEGDLPNIHAALDGSVNAELSTLVIRILGQNGLRDEDGSALIIDDDEDDHLTQLRESPTTRVACAEIR